MEDEIVQEIAERHQKSPAQILIRYSMERGMIVIPKSVTPSRIESNMNVFDFKLTAEEMARLNGLNRDFRVVSVGANKNHKYYPFKADYTEEVAGV